MSCNCKGNTYNIGMGCCQPVLAPIENYYTKWQVDDLIESATTSGCCITPEEVDEKIDEAISGKQDTLIAGDNIIISGNVISAEVPSLSGYATEQWVEEKHYLTEHQPLKTINGQVISGSGNIEIECDCDLSDYYDKNEINLIVGDMATKTWVLSQNYAKYSQIIQYATNLQDQINALRAQISGCCSDTGTTLTRWITMTGASNYTCSGTTKMTKEEEGQSTDGGNTWTPTGNYRTGSTVIEYNSQDCGYAPANLKLHATYSTSEVLDIECDGQILKEFEAQHEGSPYIGDMLTAEIGGCAWMIDYVAFATATNLREVIMNEGVEIIGQKSFSNCQNISAVTIPNSVTNIDSEAFYQCSGITNLSIGSGVTEIGNNAFNACSNITNDLNLPNIKKIGTAAFKGCNKLHSVTLGSGCTRIEGSAFEGCTSLQSVTVLATTPPDCAPYAFDNTNCPIYVPSESVEAYKAKYAWNRYADKIQAIP